MLFSEQYIWAEPIVIITIVVLVCSWIGNTIASGRNFLAALIAAILLALFLGPLAYFRLATLTLTFPFRDPAPLSQSSTPPSSAQSASPVRTVPTE